MTILFLLALKAHAADSQHCPRAISTSQALQAKPTGWAMVSGNRALSSDIKQCKVVHPSGLAMVREQNPEPYVKEIVCN